MARLVLLDADVVIRAFELGIWDKLTAKHEVVLARSVFSREVRDYRDPASGRRVPIDLGPDMDNGRLKVMDADLSWTAEADDVCCRRLGGLHGHGELESIAIAKHAARDALFCTADGYAIQAMVVIGLREQLISMEKLLQAAGLSRKFNTRADYQFSEAKFRKWVRLGSIRLAETEGL